MAARSGCGSWRSRSSAASNHAGSAVAALQRIAAGELGLQRGGLAAVGDALDGFHREAVGLDREHEAAAHQLALEAHGAGAADAVLAAEMGAGETELLAQEVGQMDAGRDLGLDRLAVHVQPDRGHAACSMPPPSRP